jgi:hypothetical protein
MHQWIKYCQFKAKCCIHQLWKWTHQCWRCNHLPKTLFVNYHYLALFKRQTTCARPSTTVSLMTSYLIKTSWYAVSSQLLNIMAATKENRKIQYQSQHKIMKNQRHAITVPQPWPYFYKTCIMHGNPYSIENYRTHQSVKKKSSSFTRTNTCLERYARRVTPDLRRT